MTVMTAKLFLSELLYNWHTKVERVVSTWLLSTYQKT